jgi:hypothetical protein
MINLIGCNKESFFKLLELMHYKPKNTNQNKYELFIYQPERKKNKKTSKKSSKSSAFDKLSELRFR